MAVRAFVFVFVALAGAAWATGNVVEVLRTTPWLP